MALGKLCPYFNANGILTTGQETTATMLIFTFIMLEQHPEVKQRSASMCTHLQCFWDKNYTLRVLDEISEVVGERTFITAEDIEQLKYMEQVC